jgi:hypothetical protein
MRELLGLDSKKTRVLRIPKEHDSTSEAGQLRAMWALQVIGGLDETDKRILLRHKSEWVRAWAIQLGREDKQITTSMTEELSRLAREDKSPLIRLYLSSGLQRIPFEHRWDILTALVQHAEDAGDHNLPLMYWYAAEPCVASDPAKAVALLKQCKIPVVREFIARRLATGSLKTVASQ